MSHPIYDATVTSLEGDPGDLNEHRGKVLLIVNTASECGFTPQLGGLQTLYDRYRDQGFEILGFPCDQFGGQEPLDGVRIGSFCQKNYGVTFPMHAKIEVNGSGAHPLYRHLRSKKSGILGSRIKWNFTKFLVDRNGAVVRRFAPSTPPEKIAPHVEELLRAGPPT